MSRGTRKHKKVSDNKSVIPNKTPEKHDEGFPASRNITEIAQKFSQRVSFSTGPIPPAEELAKYAQLIPDAPD